MSPVRQMRSGSVALTRGDEGAQLRHGQVLADVDVADLGDAQRPRARRQRAERQRHACDAQLALAERVAVAHRQRHRGHAERRHPAKGAVEAGAELTWPASESACALSAPTTPCASAQTTAARSRNAPQKMLVNPAAA